MMQQLIDDVNKALSADCYYAALSLALTFPDICGKAEFPQDKIAQRYIKWYDEYVGKFEQCPCGRCHDTPMPYLSGEVIFNLRNSFLHQGTPNIDINKIKDAVNKIEQFELILESKKPFDIYADSSGICNGYIKTYRVNVRRLCQILCHCAKSYYEGNLDKFTFINCHVVNWDAEIDKMHILI